LPSLASFLLFCLLPEKRASQILSNLPIELHLLRPGSIPPRVPGPFFCIPPSSCRRAAIFPARPALRAPGPTRAFNRARLPSRCGSRHGCRSFSGPIIPQPLAILGYRLSLPLPPDGEAARPTPARPGDSGPLLRSNKLMPPGCHFPSPPGAEGARALPRV